MTLGECYELLKLTVEVIRYKVIRWSEVMVLLPNARQGLLDVLIAMVGSPMISYQIYLSSKVQGSWIFGHDELTPVPVNLIGKIIRTLQANVIQDKQSSSGKLLNLSSMSAIQSPKTKFTELMFSPIV